jgi:ankyrin repeat protein
MERDMSDNPQDRFAQANLLSAAISAGDAGEVRHLIDGGANLGQPDKHRRLPLFVAVRDGKTGIAELLLERGADVNAVVYDDERRALFYAAEYGHLDIVRLLIVSGADVNALDCHELSALAVCALVVSSKFLNAPDQARWRSEQNRNPTGHVAVAEALILAGADVNFAPKGHYTPAHFLRGTGITRLVALVDARKPLSRWRGFFGKK